MTDSNRQAMAGEWVEPNENATPDEDGGEGAPETPAEPPVSPVGES